MKVTEEKQEGPFYTGMTNHYDKKGGYSLWLPSDWRKIKLNKGHIGMMFSPYPDDINTSILSEKHKLKYKVTVEDLPVLREGFEQGVLALPGVEVELFDHSYSDSINVFDARFTFLEGEIRRKRWARNIYWGEGQLVIIAQGRTVEDFEYWLPMFYNTISTCSII
jgi:hypothetical protein